MIFNTMVRGTDGEYPNAGYHNSIYRGKYLGTSVTADQWAEIAAGTFSDLYIGDYWTITASDGTADRTVNWTICDFDYYLNVSDAQITSHHIVMMPSAVLTLGGITLINTANAGVTVTSQESASGYKWYATMAAPNTSKTYDIPYTSSRMRTVVLPVADTLVKNAFGSSHCLTVSQLYPTSYNSSTGLATGWGWTSDDRVCDLCNENMVYGSYVWGASPYEVGMDKSQLSIFRLYPRFVNIHTSWWLRSVYTASAVTYVNSSGFAAAAGSANSLGVRPRFCIY